MTSLKSYEELLAEIEELQSQLFEATETIEAIRTGQVDALVVKDGNKHQLYTLKSADQAYRVFIEKMKEGAVTLNKNGIILYSNSQFASMVNASLSTIIGLPFSHFIPAESKEVFENLMCQGWKSDSKGEMSLTNKNNDLVPFLLSFTSLELDEGKALSIILTDLTSQKETEQQLKQKNNQLEEARLAVIKINEHLEELVAERTNDLFLSREHFKFLAENIPAIIWTARYDGTADYFNKKWYEYTGLSFEQSKDLAWQSVLHPDDQASVIDCWNEAVRNGTEFQCEYRLKRAADGTYRWHSGKGDPFKDENGNIVAWFGISIDIEDQKKEIEKKDEFISVASHELKTPLTSLKGYIQLVGIYENLPAQVYSYITKANESMTKLQNLINELLDASKVQAGKLKFNTEILDLNIYINSWIENSDHIYSSYRIKREIQPNLFVNGNADRLEQVLMNLVSNAVKYSPGKDEIIISAARNGDDVVVSVTDFGIGLSETDQKKIFERFYRVNTNNSPGLGMGLYISSELIKEHNGKIEVKSEPGKGSTFSFYLPFSK